tara:strand:+ start:226 stop:549 length:324 start_codon:yes stop_codon:yes gene_type:complete
VADKSAFLGAEVVGVAMERKCSVTSATLADFAALGTLNERCRAASVQEQDYFPTFEKGFPHQVDESPTEHLEVSIGTFFSHVDDLDFCQSASCFGIASIATGSDSLG